MKCKRCGREVLDNPNFPICQVCCQSEPETVKTYEDLAMSNMFMITDIIESKREERRGE